MTHKNNYFLGINHLFFPNNSGYAIGFRISRGGKSGMRQGNLTFLRARGVANARLSDYIARDAMVSSRSTIEGSLQLECYSNGV